MYKSIILRLCVQTTYTDHGVQAACTAVVYRPWCTKTVCTGRLYKVVCTRPCVQGSVYKAVCTRQCVQGSVYRSWCQVVCTDHVYRTCVQAMCTGHVYRPRLLRSRVAACTDRGVQAAYSKTAYTDHVFKPHRNAMPTVRQCGQYLTVSGSVFDITIILWRW